MKATNTGSAARRVWVICLSLAAAYDATAQLGRLWSTVGPGELRTAPVALTVHGTLTLGVHGQDRSITYYDATGTIEHQVFVASTASLPPVQHGGAIILLDELGRLVYSDPTVGGWQRRDGAIDGRPLDLWPVGAGYLVVLSRVDERHVLTGLSPTGRALWRRTLSDRVVDSARAGADLVLALADGRILSVQFATGPTEIARFAALATIACAPRGMFVTLQDGDLLRLRADGRVQARRGFPRSSEVVGIDRSGRVWVHSPTTSAVHVVESSDLDSIAVYRAVDRGIASVALHERDGFVLVVGEDGSVVQVTADGNAPARFQPAAGFRAAHWLADLGVLLLAYPDWRLSAVGFDHGRVGFRSTRIDRRRWNCVEHERVASTALTAFAQAALRSDRAADRERLVGVVAERTARADLAPGVFAARDALIAVVTEPVRRSRQASTTGPRARSAAAGALAAFGDATTRRALALTIRRDPATAVVVAAIESLAAYPLATEVELGALVERLSQQREDRQRLAAVTIDYLAATIATDRALYTRLLATPAVRQRAAETPR